MFETLITHYFQEIQIFVLVSTLLGGWFLWQKSQDQSQFKVREADIKRNIGTSNRKKKEPLALTGIRIHAPSHEILGISWPASKSEIEKAYRDLMKHYHPDRVAPPDSPQWKEAQKIAQAISQARSDLLSRLPK
jgi:DnaJ-class molecular chaperone